MGMWYIICGAKARAVSRSMGRRGRRGVSFLLARWIDSPQAGMAYSRQPLFVSVGPPVQACCMAPPVHSTAQCNKHPPDTRSLIVMKEATVRILQGKASRLV